MLKVFNANFANKPNVMSWYIIRWICINRITFAAFGKAAEEFIPFGIV